MSILTKSEMQRQKIAVSTVTFIIDNIYINGIREKGVGERGEKKVIFGAVLLVEGKQQTKAKM